MEDLNAASLEDVHNWFKTHYGAANAVLVLTGDIATDVALKKAEHYFGDIPAGPPVARIDQWFPENRRHEERTPEARDLAGRDFAHSGRLRPGPTTANDELAFRATQRMLPARAYSPFQR